nr:MAG TPA: hypothetical protein [Herelleviridae sp.]DAX69489.1 MAG TPA: hypothetical protein [Caudoviricetes sp.]
MTPNTVRMTTIQSSTHNSMTRSFSLSITAL